MADYPWPNPEWYDYHALARIIDSAGAADKATKISGGNPFEIYTWMTGIEQAMMNVALNESLVHAALDRITAFFEQRLERVLREIGASVDLVFLADDLGGQTGPLISGSMYRAVLQPYHRRLTQVVRRFAPHAQVMFHTGGSVFDLLPDLIDAGVQILEAVQIETAGMDPRRLKETFGDRLSFHGARRRGHAG